MPAKRLGPVVAAAAVAIAGVAGYAVYRDQIAPYRTTVLIVDDKRIDMDYFVKRVRMSGQPPLAVLQALSFEEIVKLVAPRPPYEIAVSDDDIDRLLRETAGGAGVSDAEFAEWYRQQLNETGLSEQSYRELARARLLIRGMRGYLAARVPAVAEQVRLGMIAVSSRTAAEAVKQRIDGGADFATLARELNTDPDLKARRGDVGWQSRGVLAPGLAELAFDTLAVGEASAPVPLDGETFAVFQVAERDRARTMDAENLAAAKSRAFDDWIAAEFRNHKVEYHGFDNGFDSNTDQWVRSRALTRRTMAGDDS